MDNLQERYQRQMMLPQLGEAGQQKLLSAKILVAGTGGLGCPALQYLAGAGIGTIGIIDDDTVSLDNLHRQPLFSTHDIGSSKAIIAGKKITELNPDIQINIYRSRLTNGNALQIIPDYDIILDCTDNFATRYMINDACVLLKKELVFGAVTRFEGQLAVFNHLQEDGSNSTNYRDLFPVPPADGEVMNCAEAGVLGVLPGIIGCLMANEAIKIVTGIGEVLNNKMMLLNLLDYQQQIFSISPQAATPAFLPVDENAFLQMDYAAACNPGSQFVINRERLFELLEDPETLLVDIREPGEIPEVTVLPVIQIPLSFLADKFDSFNKKTIVLFCQSGKRSLRATTILKEKFGDAKKIFSLQNGVADIIGPVYK